MSSLNKKNILNESEFLKQFFSLQIFLLFIE